MWQKIKRWFRKKYILYKYKKDGLVYLKPTDRQFGLSTFLICESVKSKTPIYVPTQRAKDYLINEQFASKHLVLCPSDITRGKRYECILVDNQCTESDIDRLAHYLGCTVKYKGFITMI